MALGTVIWSKALEDENFLIGVDFWDLDEYSRGQILALLQGEYKVNIKKHEKI